MPRAEHFGDLISADHQVLSEAVVVQDRFERKRIKVELIPLQCLCQVQMLKIERGNPLFADSGRAPSSSEIPEWLQEFTEKFRWMVKFLNTETHTPVPLMNHLQSLRLRDVWICVNTVFKLASLKTEIARSVRGPKLQGPRAEDAMAEPYLVQKILVT